MFGIGLPELAVLAFVAVLVFGPDRLPELARQAGQFVRKAKALADNARDELRSELGPQYADLELRDLDPREFVKRQIREAMADIEAEDAAASATSGEEAVTSLRKAPRPLRAGERPPYDADAT